MRIIARTCAVVLLVALGALGTNADAAPRPRITLSAPASVNAGTSATLKVAVRKAVARQRAVLQRRSGGHWVKVAAKSLPRKGALKRVRFVVRPPATTSYRVRLLAKAPARAAVSRPVLVTVRTPVPRPKLEIASTPQPGQNTDDRVRDAAMSADGRYIVYTATVGAVYADETDGISQIYRRDMVTGTTVLVSANKNGVTGDQNSDGPSVSADGRYIAYASDADNLVSGDTNTTSDVFVWDASTKFTRLVSAGMNGLPANAASREASISADGLRVAFSSAASNLIPSDANSSSDVFIRDLPADTTTRISHYDNGAETASYSANPQISPDGEHVAYVTGAAISPADTDTVADIYEWHRATNKASYVSHDAAGLSPGSADANAPSLSGDGRYVVFTDSYPFTGIGNGLDHVYRWDRSTDAVTLVDHTGAGGISNGNARGGVVSADGSTIAFASGASNLTGNPPPGLVVWRAGRYSTVPAFVATQVHAAGLSAGGRYLAVFYAGQLTSAEPLRSSAYRWGPLP